MNDQEQLERIIELLEHIALRQAYPQGDDIDYWRCRCGMENITLSSSPKTCVICQETEPLRIEAPK